MSNHKKLYSILEEMIGCAENKDKLKLRELNKQFSKIFDYDCTARTGDRLLLEYDKCRQSCLFSMALPYEYYNLMINDAKRTFKKIRHYQEANSSRR